MKFLNAKGDTIVEVLLALAVVSAVLGGAYVSSNRSLNSTRDSQERGEAIKLAEGQLERIKGTAKTNAVLFSTNAIFCLDDTSVMQNNGMGSVPALNSDTLVSPNYNAQCIKQPSGVSYYMSVQRTGNQFTVRARWNKLGGGQNEVKITYRIYP